MDYTRQAGLISMDELQKLNVTIIGVGALGSFAALTVGKMGIKGIIAYDEDGVSEHNLPNQFYRKLDAHTRRFKVSALEDILEEFTDSNYKGNKKFYKNQRLSDVVIVTTDSMSSRKIVWEQFKQQPQCHYYIEARMGGEMGRVYFIKKFFSDSDGGMFPKGSFIEKKDIAFYEKTLYNDDKAVELPCTERSIIYNVLMISSLIGRGVKAFTNNEKFPRELVFDMKNIYPFSFMVRE